MFRLLHLPEEAPPSRHSGHGEPAREEAVGESQQRVHQQPGGAGAHRGLQVDLRTAALPVSPPARGLHHQVLTELGQPPGHHPSHQVVHITPYSPWRLGLFCRNVGDLRPRETLTLSSFRRNPPDQPTLESRALKCEASKKKLLKCSSNLESLCDKTSKLQICNEDYNAEVINKFKTFSNIPRQASGNL